MTDPGAMHSEEMQLELALRALLGEETGDPAGAPPGADIPPEIAELRDVARRLRMARRWAPLSAGRGAQQGAWDIGATRAGGRGIHPRVLHRRPTRWGLAGAAAAIIFGIFGLGLGLTSSGASPSSPWYGTRLTFENLQVTLTPSPLGRAEMLVKDTRMRIAEIRTMAAAGDMRGLQRAANALDADAGWLHDILATLPAQEERTMVQSLEHM